MKPRTLKILRDGVPKCSKAKDREKKTLDQKQANRNKNYILHSLNLENMYILDKPTFISLLFQTERLSTIVQVYIHDVLFKGGYIETETVF
jgi:hypothetical protein